jgi:hypothetical protein
MKNKITPGVITALLLIALFSCKKESTVNRSPNAELSINKHSNASSIFLEINHISLKNAISAGNEDQIASIVNGVANNVANYFFDKYKIDVKSEFANNPEGLVLLGLYYAAKEKKSLLNVFHPQGIMTFSNDEDIECFLTAVGTFIGITEARNIWKSIVAGANEEAVITSLALLNRRITTKTAAGIMVKESGKCLGFW